MLGAREPAPRSDGDRPQAGVAPPLTSIQQFESPDDAAADRQQRCPQNRGTTHDAPGDAPGGGFIREGARAPGGSGHGYADIQTSSGVPAVPIATGPAPAGNGAAQRQPSPASAPIPTAAGGSGFAVVALAACGVGAAALAVPAGGLRLLMVLTFIVAGPGAAVVSLARMPGRLVASALAVTAGMTVACGTAVTMVWTHTWHPRAAFCVLVGVAGSTALLALVRRPRPALPGTGGMPGGARPWGMRLLRRGRDGAPRPAAAAPGWRSRCRAAAPIAVLAAATLLWVLSMVRFRPSAVGSWGLTAAIGAPFVAAVLLLCVAFALELFGRARVVVLSAGLVLTAAVLHATVPLLYDSPEYAWTYKHFGVVELILDNGHLISSTDIYQQWPGFFATMALVFGVAGVDALAYGAWSSVAFALLTTVLLAALLRQFTSNRRVIVLGVLVFRICMWVDVGYFSPQAFVYVLMLGFWLIVARWLLAWPDQSRPGTGRLARARAVLLRGSPGPASPDPPTAVRATRVRASIAATLAFAAITVSHQLTPFMMLGPAVILAVLGVLRPRLLVVVLGLVVIGFTAPRLSAVVDQYSIFSFDVVSNSTGNAATWRSDQQQFSALIARALTAAVWAVAAFAVWRARKRLGTVLVAAIITFTPFVTLLGGNYGGEAIYRVFAFSMPFVGLLIAAMWMSGKSGALETGTSAVILAVAMMADLQGLQGQLVVNRVPPADIEAARYFYANAVPGSSLVLAAPTFPTRLTANYGAFNEGRTIDVSLIRDPEFVARLDGSRLPVVEDYIRRLGSRDNYLAVSSQMAVYADYYGLLPPGATRSLHDALNSSPHWLLFYRGPGVTIYHLPP